MAASEDLDARRRRIGQSNLIGAIGLMLMAFAGICLSCKSLQYPLRPVHFKWVLGIGAALLLVAILRWPWKRDGEAGS